MHSNSHVCITVATKKTMIPCMQAGELVVLVMEGLAIYVNVQLHIPINLDKHSDTITIRLLYTIYAITLLSEICKEDE